MKKIIAQKTAIFLETSHKIKKSRITKIEAGKTNFNAKISQNHDFAINPILLTQKFPNAEVKKDAKLLYSFLSSRLIAFNKKGAFFTKSLPKKLRQYPAIDLIFILGNNDLACPNHAAAIYHEMQNRNQKPPKIMVSGKGGHTTIFAKPVVTTEAEAFEKVLIELGVAPEDIILEKKATNTRENIVLSEKILKEKGITHNRLALITSPGIQQKSYQTFLKNGWDFDCLIVSPPTLDSLKRISDQALNYTLAYGLRELAILKHYVKNTHFLDSIQIPASIEKLLIKYDISDYFPEVSGTNDIAKKAKLYTEYFLGLEKYYWHI